MASQSGNEFLKQYWQSTKNTRMLGGAINNLPIGAYARGLVVNTFCEGTKNAEINKARLDFASGTEALLGAGMARRGGASKNANRDEEIDPTFANVVGGRVYNVLHWPYAALRLTREALLRVVDNTAIRFANFLKPSNEDPKAKKFGKGLVRSVLLGVAYPAKAIISGAFFLGEAPAWGLSKIGDFLPDASKKLRDNCYKTLNQWFDRPQLSNKDGKVMTGLKMAARVGMGAVGVVLKLAVCSGLCFVSDAVLSGFGLTAAYRAIKSGLSGKKEGELPKINSQSFIQKGLAYSNSKNPSSRPPSARSTTRMASSNVSSRSQTPVSSAPKMAIEDDAPKAASDGQSKENTSYIKEIDNSVGGVVRFHHENLPKTEEVKGANGSKLTIHYDPVLEEKFGIFGHPAAPASTEKSENAAQADRNARKSIGLGKKRE